MKRSVTASGVHISSALLKCDSWLELAIYSIIADFLFLASVTSASSLGAPSPDNDVGGLYTAVDKGSKQRQTIHVFEGVGAEATNLDELYAKVHKPNRGTTNQEEQLLTRAKLHSVLPDLFSTQERPRSLPAGLDPCVSCTNMVVVREFEEKSGGKLVEALPPPPEEYADPAYERVYHQDSSDTDPCYERVSGGHVDNAVSDSGYEKVSKRFECEPGYETIRKDASTECNQSAESNYERIWKSDKASSVRENDCEAEHSYERIKGPKGQQDEDISEPGYEEIHDRGGRVDDDASDPGYERINKSHSDACSQADSDPGYERIKDARAVRDTGRNGSGAGYERIQRKPEKNGGSSDETYESLADDRVRKLGYSLMKEGGSSGDSPSPPVRKQASESSSASDHGAPEDSSSEEPGYERVRARADTDVTSVRPVPRKRLVTQAKVWRCSDSNLTVSADTAERATSTYSLNTNLNDGSLDEGNGDLDDSGAVLYEVVRDANAASVQLELVTDNEPVPIVWARNTGHRSSDHKEREYIF